MPAPRLLISSIAAFVLQTACSSGTGGERPHTGGVVRPGSNDERRVLAQLDSMPSETPTRVGRIVVEAEPPYYAASGRMCRRVRMSGRSRLACKGNPSWFYVPEVLAAP